MRRGGVYRKQWLDGIDSAKQFPIVPVEDPDPSSRALGRTALSNRLPRIHPRVRTNFSHIPCSCRSISVREIPCRDYLYTDDRCSDFFFFHGGALYYARPSTLPASRFQEPFFWLLPNPFSAPSSTLGAPLSCW